MPKIRGKEKIAKLAIPVGAGVSYLSENGHIDFWAYVHFDFVAAIAEVG